MKTFCTSIWRLALTQNPKFTKIGLCGLEPTGRQVESIQSRCPKWTIGVNIQVLPLPSEV